MGFFRVLQPKEETKLVTPWTAQVPFSVGQLRGPPESPCNGEKRRGWGVSEDKEQALTSTTSINVHTTLPLWIPVCKRKPAYKTVRHWFSI